MYARYRYRIYPTPIQCEALAKAFGCARVVFNDGLRLRQEAYTNGLPYINDSDLQKIVLTQAKRTEERAWLAEVSQPVLAQALRDLHAAYRNFFRSVSGQRKGRKMRPPRFRSLKSRQSIGFSRTAFSIGPGRRRRLYLAKIGDVRVHWSRDLPATPSSVRVIKDPSGRYFAIFVVEMTSDPLPETAAEVGIDLGLKHFAVLSDGHKVPNPRIRRQAEHKLRKAHRAMSRKEQGSANREKARVRLAKLHAKVADTRRDHAHKLSTQIIRDNQAVYVEDVYVNGLARGRLAKSMYDVGWSQFIDMLEYKAIKHGRYFTRIGRWEPTSQVCSACGAHDGPKPLRIRSWTCTSCGTVHDRDVNAARNILALGRRERLNACGGTVRPGLVPARPDEAGTRQGGASTPFSVPRLHQPPAWLRWPMPPA